jgi:predicted secreted protein
LLLGAVLALAPAFASAFAAAPAETPTAGTVLHLSAQAERQVTRDRLRAVLRVEGVESSATRLQAEINRRLTAALARAKAVPEVSSATGGYAVQRESGPNQSVRWRGSATLTLTAREAGPLLDLVGALQQDGVVVGSLGYELTPEAAQAVEDELTASALTRLRERAERVASELGLAVDRIRELRLGNATGAGPQPRVFLAQAGASASASASAPVADPGEATVTVSLEADVLLAAKP